MNKKSCSRVVWVFLKIGVSGALNYVLFMNLIEWSDSFMEILPSNIIISLLSIFLPYSTPFSFYFPTVLALDKYSDLIGFEICFCSYLYYLRSLLKGAASSIPAMIILLLRTIAENCWILISLRQLPYDSLDFNR